MKEPDPLDFEEVAEYLEQPEAVAHAGFRRRLLESRLSRRRVDLAWRVRNTLRSDPQCVMREGHGESALTPALRRELQLLAAGQLDSERRASLHERLQADPDLLREALHFSFAERGKPEPAAREQRRFELWLERLLAWRVPAWAAAATAAVLMLAVLVLAPYGVPDDRGLQIAGYRDDPVIRFAGEDALPGLGFFADAQTETRPFGNVQVRLQDEGLAMSWPQVPGASGYTVRLFVVEQSSQREVAKVDVATNSAVLESVALQAARRYVWVISGATDSKRKFATRGGFVLR